MSVECCGLCENECDCVDEQTCLADLREQDALIALLESAPTEVGGGS